MALDASGIKVYCRGADLSTVLQSTAIEQTREEADVTAYADSLRKMQATLARVSLAHAGLYEEGANTLSEVFRQANATDDEPITVFADGTTVGNKAFIVRAHRAGITVPDAASPGSVHKASLRASSQYPLGNGQVGFLGTVSANSQTTALQLGALTAGQLLLATVHLIGITPTPSATFFLESDNGVGFASPIVQATSAAQTARGSVLLVAAGPNTDDWWRVRWTFSGTGNFTAAIALAVAG